MVIAGPCMLESRDLALRTAETVAGICARLALPYIFKSSYLKANRTSQNSPMGPGLAEGLRILARDVAAEGHGECRRCRGEGRARSHET